MKKIAPTAIFLILIFYISSLSFRAFSSEETESILENRALSKFPDFNREELFSGRYFEGIESFLSDHIPNRDIFLEFKMGIDNLRGKELNLSALDTRDDFKISNNDKYKKYQTRTENVKILSFNDKIFSTFNFDEDYIENFIKNINNLSKRYDITTHVEVVPISISLEDYDFRRYSDPQDMALEYIYKNIDKNINKINLFKTLYNERDNYIYFRTDHHWTMRGSYFGAKDFLKSINIDIDDFNDYSSEKYSGFIGYQSRKYPVKKVINNPDIIEVYNNINYLEPEMDLFYYNEENKLDSYKDKMINPNRSEEHNYGMFFGGDHPLVKLKNKNPKTDKKLLVIKDSFANIFIPWLYPYFSEITMVDPRYYKDGIDSLLSSENFSDLLILININSISSTEYADKFNKFVEN